ncbi:MAG: hypothetical protein CMI53_05000 [Parcubacteria group bacterium]|nr:hypothetical protein [Parcubacteria group bacterium]
MLSPNTHMILSMSLITIALYWWITHPSIEPFIEPFKSSKKSTNLLKENKRLKNQNAQLKKKYRQKINDMSHQVTELSSNVTELDDNVSEIAAIAKHNTTTVCLIQKHADEMSSVE